MSIANLDSYYIGWIMLGMTVGGGTLLLERLAQIVAGKKSDIGLYYFLFVVPLLLTIAMAAGAP